MKAAIVKEKGTIPVMGHFDFPVATDGQVVINVSATALSRVSKFRSMGMHYSSKVNFPIVAGLDGVGTLKDGTRVYFALPTAPYGSLAEQTIVNEKLTVRLPDGINDLTAAAIANPAMSSWAALVFRADFKPGQTVLINGATGASGSLAVQIAKGLGAKKIIVTGRNESKLQVLEADEAIAFDMTADNGQNRFENALMSVVAEGVDVVLDYLWGDSALAIMSALARAHTDRTTRFVSIGTSSGQENIHLPSSILRSSTIELVGSGDKSVSKADMLSAVKGVFDMAAEGKLKIAIKEFALEDIEVAWNAPLTPRPVVKVQ
ncbi:alcohol dehydrogenase [Paenibacillus chitinolyticus]|uniref:Alcohol dehydrogenase n=1 Tax=Paenibacillus chitinolyticus TaxID=79263 RepID=A0A410WUT0_9BACL|nr:zinc-binding alcohol dehydrogenase family protein [Paenibacillus chitinolyticus]MCY9594071.1 zinc-binding alcohol dehydrogenase family protein [Paenibacillus chitinolyticus]MCY9596156.1 zinc-binding alcohol dehydrogenase family protein [Paenibacillus chitinolyticus]QAV18112.1 alcohol dehydrogenase [Paenibacillus chitinolyticus]